MIWSTYHVFGSGCSGVYSFARKGMRLSEYVAACKELSSLRVYDGDNGFMGTYKVPDAEAEKRGIVRRMWAEPGLKANPKPPEGFVTVNWYVRQVVELAAVMDVTVETLYEISKGCRRYPDVEAALHRRKAIIASVMVG